MQGTPKQNAIAVSLVVALMVFIFARIWAQNQERNHAGPTLLAAQESDAYVLVGDTLYHLSAHGELLQRASLASLKLESPLIDLQRLDDGSVVVAERNARRLSRCDLAAMTCTPHKTYPATVIDGVFKFYIDESTGSIYLADAGRHRLWRDSLAQTAPQLLDDAKLFQYPNDIHPDVDGLLRIADTNHFRSPAVRVNGNALELTGVALEAAHPQARTGHHWPIGLTRDSRGGWWVLNADGFLGDADVVSYDANGSPLRRVPLPSDADAVDIAALGDTILIADRAGVAVHAINPDAQTPRAFGAGEFARDLAGIRAARERYSEIASALVGFIVVSTGGLLLLAVGIVRAGAPVARGAGQLPQATPLARHTGVHWLARDPARESQFKNLRRLVPVMAVLHAGVLILLAFGVSWLSLPAMPASLMLAIAYILLGAPALLLLTLKSWRARIGIRGSLLYLADRHGMVTQVPPEAMVYSQRELSYGPLTVLLKNGHGQDMLSPQAQAELAPLLRRARRIGGINMLLYRFSHGNGLAIGQWAFLAVAVILMLSAHVL